MNSFTAETQRHGGKQKVPLLPFGHPGLKARTTKRFASLGMTPGKGDS